MSFMFSDLFGGGMPGGGGGGAYAGHDSDDDEGATDTSRYYEVLGVSKSASELELKKAYRQKAREVHPDRHPSEREKYHALFQEVQTAYETLKDPHKRQLYDKFGEKGVKRGGGGGGHGDISDVLSQFFGGGDPRGGGRGQRGGGRKQSPAIKKVIDVSLEDLYLGVSKKVKVTRKVAENSDAECPRCHGSGAITVTQRMGPMMIQQRAKCSTCGGQGYQLTEEEVEVEIHIPIGGRHGETVTVAGEGNRYPNHEAGDVAIQLRQGKHDVFKRQGADLGMTHTLSLRQALCGYRIKIEHVSGHTLVVSSREGEVVQPGQLKRVYSYGMPIRYQAHTKGHLYIVMEIKLPLAHSLSDGALTAFRQILPDIDRDDDFDMDEKVADTSKSNAKGKGKDKGKNQSNDKTKKMKTDDGEESGTEDEEEEPAIYLEEVEADDVDDNPKATPASAKSSYEEDESNEHVQQCRHM